MARVSYSWMPDARAKFDALPQHAQAAYATMIGHIAANPAVGRPDRASGKAVYKRNKLEVRYTVMGKGTHFTVTDLA